MKRSASRARGPALGGAVLRCSVTSSREATRGERPRGSRGLARWQRGRLAQLHRKVRPWFWSTYVRATLRPPCRQGAPGCTSRHSGCQEKASALRRFASASGTESVLGMRVPVITTRSEGHLPSAFLRDQPTPSLLSGGSGCPVGQHSKPVTGPDGGPCGFQGSRPRPAREQLGLLPPMATKPSSVPSPPWVPLWAAWLPPRDVAAWRGGRCVWGGGPQADLCNPLSKGHRNAGARRTVPDASEGQRASHRGWRGGLRGRGRRRVLGGHAVSLKECQAHAGTCVATASPSLSL